MILKHIVKNQADELLIESIAQSGLQGMTYDFFAALSAEIESEEAAGNLAAAERLGSIRSMLLQLQEQVQAETQQMLGGAKETLDSILAADDMKQALEANISQVDDAFMYVLAAEMSQAEESNQTERAERIDVLRNLIVEQIEGQTPPELRLLNNLVRAESDEEMEALIARNAEYYQKQDS